MDPPEHRSARRRRPSRRAVLAVVAVAGLVVGITGCGNGDEGAAGGSGLRGTLNGSGATFPQAFYEEAIFDFTHQHRGTTLTYGGGGSGKGRQDLADRVIDFAGSDTAVEDADLARFKGGDLLHFPTAAAPITVSYNLPDVEDLRFSADALARIFQREIRTWDDPAIAADNPGVRLPASAITVARRSDGSGTTENFTRFLAAAAPGTWTLGSGATVTWPSGTQAGNGNAGVAQIVGSAEGAVGYVDFADAHALGLSVARVRNVAGEYVAPTLEAASAAVAGARVGPNLAYDPLNAAGEGVYPITAPTWILVYRAQPAAKVELMRAWLEFLLTDAQEWVEEIDYAALPEPLRRDALAQLDEIVAR